MYALPDSATVVMVDAESGLLRPGGILRIGGAGRKVRRLPGGQPYMARWAAFRLARDEGEVLRSLSLVGFDLSLWYTIMLAAMLSSFAAGVGWVSCHFPVIYHPNA